MSKEYDDLFKKVKQSLYQSNNNQSSNNQSNFQNTSIDIKKNLVVMVNEDCHEFDEIIKD